MKRKVLIILLAVVLVGGLIGGAFIGGMAMGKNQGREQANQELQSQFQSGFGQGGTQGTPQPGSPPSGGLGGLFGRQGTVGIVEKVEGNVMTLNAGEGTVRVLIADNTSIQKMGEGSLNDISPGQTVTVSGERKDDGSIAATTIFITQGLRAQ